MTNKLDDEIYWSEDETEYDIDESLEQMIEEEVLMYKQSCCNIDIQIDHINKKSFLDLAYAHDFTDIHNYIAEEVPPSVGSSNSKIMQQKKRTFGLKMTKKSGD